MSFRGARSSSQRARRGSNYGGKGYWERLRTLGFLDDCPLWAVLLVNASIRLYRYHLLSLGSQTGGFAPVCPSGWPKWASSGWSAASRRLSDCAKKKHRLDPGLRSGQGATKLMIPFSPVFPTIPQLTIFSREWVDAYQHQTAYSSGFGHMI